MLKKFLLFPVLMFAVACMGTSLVGQDEDGGEATDFKSIEAEYDSAYQEFIKAYRAEKDADKKRELISDMPRKDDYADAIFAFAKSAEADDAAEALGWLIAGASNPDIKTKATDTLLNDHIESKHIESLVSSVARSMPSQEVVDTLNKIIEKSPHHDVQGKATYNLVQFYQRLEMYTGNEQIMARLPEEVREFLEDMDSDAVAEKLDGLIGKINSDYSDVMLNGSVTIGDKIGAVVFEKERLQIGMEVPDIEGEDLDGENFKLSDYRGKVVVLDFWGDW